ncbi:hypothetical protein ACFYOK_26255 [Microbispora bryophytorum]|uniref:hypothetical protein n=1 Tax=Microbispora bryophytorum TaxID=1460882 RepID=UPI003408D22A
MNDEDSVNELIATLRPDSLTEEAHRRRRSADLAQAFQTPRAPHHTRRFPMPQRRPLYLITGTALAGLAAAAIIVPQVLSGDSSPHAISAGESPGGVGGVGGVGGEAFRSTETSTTTVNTRTVLLAAAKVSTEEPAGSGKFWYSRVRTTQLVQVAPDEYAAKIKKLLAEQDAKKEHLKNKPDELNAAMKEFDKKVHELKTTRLPYAASRSETTDTWRSLGGAAGRRVTGLDVKIAFATPADEAKWKQAGSPRLADDPSGSRETLPTGVVSIDNPSLTWSNVAKLPTDKQGLKDRLLSLHAKSPVSGRKQLADYLWQTGADLLTAPITPGTRAALYQVLADSASGLKSSAGVTDALGRTGVALDTTGPDDAGEAGRITYRLIFDDKTGKALELDVIEAGTAMPLLQQTFETTGYVDALGDTPAQ